MTDSSGGSEDGYLGVGWRGGVNASGGRAQSGDGFGGKTVEHHGSSSLRGCADMML